MLRKLELDALNVDLAAVSTLLEQAVAAGDPIGELQFTQRRKEIEETIHQLAATPEHTAGVALFFGGRPVVGSKGISAEFAGKVLESFQDLITKRFATFEVGALGQRGPAPFKPDTHMLVTDVARGSFGFVLEESAANASLTDTAVKHTLDELTELVTRVASPDDKLFESAVENLDPRMLGSMRTFFRNLDDAGATIRIVEGDRDQSLTYSDVQRARLRIETMEITEKETDSLVGELIGLLPEHRKFELRLADTGELIYGSVSQEFTKGLLRDLMAKPSTVLGKLWRTKMNIREVRERNRPPKHSYTLLGLLEEVSQKK